MLTILQLISSSGFYGAERVVLELSIELNKNGYQSILGCIVNNAEDRPLLTEKAEAVGLKARCFPSKGKKIGIAILRLKEALKRDRINLIHAHGFKATILGLIAGKQIGVPIIVTGHLWTRENRRLKCYAWLEARFMKLADRVIAVSESVKLDMIEMGLRQSRIIVVHNGISLNEYSPTTSGHELRHRLGLDSHTKLIGTLARIVHSKGIKYLIDAGFKVIKNDPKIEMLIAGDGQMAKEMIDYVRSVGLASKIHFVGFQPESFELLKILDVFVLPSLAEGLPMTILEAMAVGTPVIATSVGGTPEIILHLENGVLVKPRDSLGLGTAIEMILNNTKLTKKIVTNAKVTVEKYFSTPTMANKYISIYKNVSRNL